MLTPSRRGLLTGLGALLVAPAIVRASSIMRISVLPELVLNASSLEQALIEIRRYVDDPALRLSMLPTHVLVQPELMERAVEVRASFGGARVGFAVPQELIEKVGPQRAARDVLRAVKQAHDWNESWVERQEATTGLKRVGKA